MTTSLPPALPGAVFYLHAPAELAMAELDDLPKEVNGEQVAYFWADGIRAGKYVHPAGKFELNVDSQRLDTWVDNFRRMREAGVDVPVPVDHSSKARDNLGYVVDIKRNGNTLKLLHQLIGEDAIRLASRNKVSLGIDPAFKDGQGRAFGDCIVHSSLTPVPLVPGQEGLVPLSTGEAVVFCLDADSPVVDRREGELFATRVGELVRRGHITPACAAGIIELFDPRQEAGRVLLSRESGGGAMDALVAALQHNTVLAFGEMSGVQTLSRVVPGNEPSVDPDLQLKMVKMASGVGGK